MAVRKPLDDGIRRRPELWGPCPHFLDFLRPDGQQHFQLWGQGPHNLGVKAVKAEVAVELSVIAVADFVGLRKY